jgi:hypothetical protein
MYNFLPCWFGVTHDFTSCSIWSRTCTEFMSHTISSHVRFDIFHDSTHTRFGILYDFRSHWFHVTHDLWSCSIWYLTWFPVLCSEDKCKISNPAQILSCSIWSHAWFWVTHDSFHVDFESIIISGHSWTFLEHLWAHQWMPGGIHTISYRT